MSLGKRLRNALDKLQGSSSIDKEIVKEAVKEIQRALIASDVEVNLVLNLSKKIEEKAFEKIPAGLSRQEHVIKTTYELLSQLLGKQDSDFKEPKKVLLVGLFGSGKTTSSAKIAKWFSKRGKKTALIAADTHRPASFEQLQQLSKKVNVDFFGNPKEKNPEKIVETGLKKFKNKDLIIVDSAGRSALDENLTKEIVKVKKTFKPDAIWLVLSADIGQVAKKQAQHFNKALGITGIIITKMDGSSKGGGALAACAETSSPVLFIGTGEKPDDFEQFDNERFLSRIMGYGDLQSLLEKAKTVSLESDLSPEQMLQQDFTLKSFYQQLEASKKIGPLDKVADMLGLKMQLPQEQLDLGQEKLDNFKVMMDSMTKQEQLQPDVMNSSRINRIAKGSGRTEQDVRELLKSFKQSKKMFDQFKKMQSSFNPEKMSQKDVENLMKKFQPKKKKKFRLR